MLHVGAEPIDAPCLLGGFGKGDGRVGAIASFVGVVRGEAEAEALELEHYPGFTESRIDALMRSARERFGLQDVLVVHRVGRIAAGEAVVVVAAAATHRRAAFAAVDYLMDHLKTSAAFWKKEHGRDGARWIEPRSEDHQDLARWTQGDDAR